MLVRQGDGYLCEEDGGDGGHRNLEEGRLHCGPNISPISNASGSRMKAKEVDVMVP